MQCLQHNVSDCAKLRTRVDLPDLGVAAVAIQRLAARRAYDIPVVLLLGPAAVLLLLLRRRGHRLVVPPAAVAAAAAPAVLAAAVAAGVGRPLRDGATQIQLTCMHILKQRWHCMLPALLMLQCSMACMHASRRAMAYAESAKTAHDLPRHRELYTR
jgi:hypothetical protein